MLYGKKHIINTERHKQVAFIVHLILDDLDLGNRNFHVKY